MYQKVNQLYIQKVQSHEDTAHCTCTATNTHSAPILVYVSKGKSNIYRESASHKDIENYTCTVTNTQPASILVSISKGSLNNIVIMLHKMDGTTHPARDQ